MHTNIEPRQDFGEVEALQEVFAEAKRRRQVRQPPHVLLVEDDALTRRIVTGTFKDNYAMLSACTAHEALADYLMYAPDVVFLDIGLPGGVDGFAVLDQILKADPEAFVVMFSGNLYPENVRRAQAAGARGWVPKPFKKDVLRSYIQGSVVHHRKFWS